MPKVGRNTPPVPTDHLAISLRSYVTRTAKEEKKRGIAKGAGNVGRENARRLHASDWVLIFDCETATTPDQRLKFGNYQLRQKGNLVERGVFHEPGALTTPELATLRRTLAMEEGQDSGPAFKVHTRHQFIEKVLFTKGHRTGAQIVGFNLPFDISRLAIRHVNARGNMKGGFSFVLIDDDKWPTISVKHMSQRMSFIHFTGLRPKPQDDAENKPDVDRGFFVDLKTLAGALLSESHSLESLSRLLKIPSPKLSTEDHGGIIDAEYVRYALRDVQATWECFEVLARQLEGLRLIETTPSSLFSEASLGKAYLRTMGVNPWQDVQPDYPPASIGRILSTYFGGRSEVHIRREITPVIHCDFLSMYPTVCTLMGLWDFVTASGINETDDTDAVRRFVSTTTAAKLKSKAAWTQLAAIVQVLPEGDLFPVRAHYGEEDQATIGLNYLTSDQPMWFTLSDVLVSKILTGKVPNIVKAIRFSPGRPQAGLQLVTVAGQVIDPAKNDFYKSLIIHRLQIGNRLKNASDDEKPRLEADRQAIKILANSTSYGIFVELNVKDYERAKDFTAFGTRNRAATIRSKKFEDPGRYFHPLLGTLITGAARLMLALAERQVIDQGLDWAFCDTDSLAIANVAKLPKIEFLSRALKVQQWFSKLNPYGRPDSILQLEKVNFPPSGPADVADLEPPLCLAVSAKRYVLFNRDSKGDPVIRKASGHGLGYLLPPYDEPAGVHRERMNRIGVPSWQEDVWKAIIRAAEGPEPDQVSYSKITNFSEPAASRYGSTSPELLAWFAGYNGIGKGRWEKPYREQVKPFNFLLSLQSKSRLEMASADMAALANHPLWKGREPHPAAPYHKKVGQAIKQVFDRTVPELSSIPKKWLKSYGRSLARYHMHPEAKFLGGSFDERGILRRRHVQVLSFRQIGKEADNLKEREYIGDSSDDVVEHGLMREDRVRLCEHILAVQKEAGISVRELCNEAGLSPRTLNGLSRNQKVEDGALFALVEAVERLRATREVEYADAAAAFASLQQKRAELGSDAAMAKYLRVSRSYATYLLNGARPLSLALRERLHAKKRDGSD